MTTKTRHENAEAKRAYAINPVCPYCGAVVALGVNLVVERREGRVIGALCLDCDDAFREEGCAPRREQQ